MEHVIKLNKKMFNPISRPWPFKMKKCKIHLDTKTISLWLVKGGKAYALNGNAIELNCGENIDQLKLSNNTTGAPMGSGPVIDYVAKHLMEPLGLV